MDILSIATTLQLDAVACRARRDAAWILSLCDIEQYEKAHEDTEIFTHIGLPYNGTFSQWFLEERDTLRDRRESHNRKDKVRSFLICVLLI
ncbi:hypothetical protein LTR10_018796 [Elasticomyces elasticus]|uniref:Uncharacterized protein n=1 Tax=Exophiala sideris TaxID=1016849 RepID=A0ABR0J891_9EURO|nr:hypothetical protein LTR10_018796 [Elasticomyces elasticus]KAK5029922.1 hypothetical protein LTS07_005646 [Exophiala sideris]KAK5031638.1 hypothetical protein LTR13_007627 [Exophiala sideris]KAK5058316.1 hypothetical protein LTR69_006720 [Exophiala sideris]KAK5180245.1 hypothetical protein LTR44_007370 [Eurotiomycetes sp. CCFEE 6388]